jgi:hypothetical protein
MAEWSSQYLPDYILEHLDLEGKQEKDADEDGAADI